MDYAQIAEDVVEEISSRGADAEVFITDGKETQIVVDRGKIEKLSYAGSKGLGIRVIRDGKMGYAYTSDFTPTGIEKTWNSALELLNVADEDENRILPEPTSVEVSELDIFDPTIVDLEMEEKVQKAFKLEQATLSADPRIVMTNRCTYRDGHATYYLANSRGFSGSYRKSLAVSIVIAIGREEEESTMAYGIGASTHSEDLDVKAIGMEAGKKAAALLGGQPVKTQESTVVMDPIAGSELVGALAQALTAEAMQRGRSFLLNKIGHDIASDVVTLVDNGRFPRGISSAPFDAEGVPTGATRMVDEGTLQAVIYDTYTAHMDGRKSTGNAARGSHRTPPRVSTSNFYLQPGTSAPEDILAEVKSGLYVTSTMNVGGINPVSGDYSVAARGMWIENGQLTHPVNEVTIALPLELLLKQIQKVGNDLRFVPLRGSFGAPTIRIDGMTIAGKL